jgi:hypothetical protein
MLSGCGGQSVVEPPQAEEPSAPPSTEPSTQPQPDPQRDVLFTITANVRSVDGSTVGISMAAHSPVASTDPEAVDLKNEFLSVCGAGNGTQAIDDQYLADQGSTLLLVEFSTDSPGLEFAAPLDLFFGSPYFAQAASGDGIEPGPGGPTCFYGFRWTTSGSARGIANFENPDGQPDLTQWQYGHYGFTVSPDSGATIEACNVTISETGMKSGIDQVSGWDPSRAATGISCGIGYSGE